MLPSTTRLGRGWEDPRGEHDNYFSLSDCTGDGITIVVKYQGNQFGGNEVVFAKPFASTHTNPFLDYGYFSNNFGAGFEVRIGSNTRSLSTGIASTSEYVDIAFVADGTDWKIYTDGTEADSTVNSNPPTNTNSQALLIGQNADGNETFGGNIKHIFLFDRPLNANEVLALYESPYDILEPIAPIYYFPTITPAASTYTEDIANLGADHHWIFDGDSTDEIGSANGTDSSVIYTDSAIAKDATNCMTTNAIAGDRVSLPTTTTINNSAQDRKAVCDWFEATSFNAHPVRIYGEGTEATVFQFCMGYGNNLILECTEPTNFATGLQIFGPPMVPNRVYHLCGIFSGNGHDNEIKLFVDGVEQTNADPSDRQPDTADLNLRGVGEFGDPAGTVGLGGAVVIQQAATNGRYQHWAAWGDEADALLTDTEIRETLFERGALAEETITTDTEANMQTDVDALPASIGDAPCCIEVEAVTGGGDFTLTSDTTFDELASIHVRYNGTADTLTWINTGSGDASIGSAPFGGTLVIKNRQTLTVTVVDAVTGSAIQDAYCYIEADTGGPETAGTVIMSTTTNASGVATATFDYESDQPIIGYIRKGTSSTYYKQNSIGGPLTSIPLDVTVQLVPDE